MVSDEVITADGAPRSSGDHGRHGKSGVHARGGLPAALWWGAVVVGGAVRIEQFATRRSLWLDEALVTMNIIQRGFGGLARPLAYSQAAPVGGLWGPRALVAGPGVKQDSPPLIPSW